MDSRRASVAAILVAVLAVVSTLAIVDPPAAVPTPSDSDAGSAAAGDAPPAASPVCGPTSQQSVGVVEGRDGAMPDYDGDGDPDSLGPVSCSYPWTQEDHLWKVERLIEDGLDPEVVEALVRRLGAGPAAVQSDNT